MPKRGREGSSSSNTIFLGLAVWGPGCGCSRGRWVLDLWPRGTSGCRHRRYHGFGVTGVSESCILCLGPRSGHTHRGSRARRAGLRAPPGATGPRRLPGRHQARRDAALGSPGSAGRWAGPARGVAARARRAWSAGGLRTPEEGAPGGGNRPPLRRYLHTRTRLAHSAPPPHAPPLAA
jgi:hypothetical protein